MNEYLIISITMYIVGVYRNQMIALWLLLCYYISDAMLALVNPSSLEATLVTYYMLEPFVFLLFFMVCYRYCGNWWEQSAIWIAVVGYYSIGSLHYFYIPWWTEFVMNYGEMFRVEIIHNLCLTIAIECRKEEYGWARMMILIYVFLVLKLWSLNLEWILSTLESLLKGL